MHDDDDRLGGRARGDEAGIPGVVLLAVVLGGSRLAVDLLGELGEHVGGGAARLGGRVSQAGADRLQVEAG